jgi:hypothetical protein
MHGQDDATKSYGEANPGVTMKWQFCTTDVYVYGTNMHTLHIGNISDLE